MAHRLPRHAPAAPTSPGRVMTKWTKPAATASPNSMHTGRSPARSVSTMAMNPASKPALGDFFNSLLEPADGDQRRRRSRAHGEEGEAPGEPAGLAAGEIENGADSERTEERAGESQDRMHRE